jgi:hypothetical protein
MTGVTTFHHGKNAAIVTQPTDRPDFVPPTAFEFLPHLLARIPDAVDRELASSSRIGGPPRDRLVPRHVLLWFRSAAALDSRISPTRVFAQLLPGLAGGGIKPGVSVGETDELGGTAVTDRCHVKNIHATILNQMGLDPNKLAYFYGGLDQKLVGVEGADPIKQLVKPGVTVWRPPSVPNDGRSGRR